MGIIHFLLFRYDECRCSRRGALWRIDDQKIKNKKNSLAPPCLSKGPEARVHHILAIFMVPV